MIVDTAKIVLSSVHVRSGVESRVFAVTEPAPFPVSVKWIQAIKVTAKYHLGGVREYNREYGPLWEGQ